MLSKVFQRIQQFKFYETFLHSVNYFGAIILINALGIVSLWVYTKYLETDSFGIVETFNTLIKIFPVIMVLNIHAAVSRYYYEEKEDWREFLGTIFILAIGIFSVLFILVFSFRNWISDALNIPVNIFLLVFPMSIFIVIFSIFQMLYIARKESRLVSLGQVMMSYFRFFGAFAFLVFYASNYQGKILGDVIFASVVAVFIFSKIWPHIRWSLSFKKEHLRYILNYSIPLIPFSLSVFVVNAFDLLMINSNNNADAGLYAFAYKIGLLYYGFEQALHNAAKPDFYSWFNRGQVSEMSGQIKSMLKFEIWAAIFLVYFAVDLGTLLAARPEYTTSLHLVPVIVTGYVFFGFYSFYSRLLFYSKKTIYISCITIFAGILNIVLNSIFIPIHGYEAAAYTTLFTFIVLLILGYITSIVILKLPQPPLAEFFKQLIFFGIFAAIGLWIINSDFVLWQSLLFKALLFLIAGLLLFGNKLKGLIAK